MFPRFLNNNDYISIVTEEALDQLIRGNEERLAQAEEAAEQSVLEYLTENYEVEAELAVGKNLLPYNPHITYPAGAHFYIEDKIYQTLRTINGVKAPEAAPYWAEYEDPIEDESTIEFYTQRRSYEPGDIVRFGAAYFECLEYNGPDFDDIRVPGVKAWEPVEFTPWEANVDYPQWSVVLYKGKYYTLMADEENRNLTVNPEDSDDWGQIGDYTTDYTYELTDTEYVVYSGIVYHPIINPNADKPVESYNIKAHDPRNANLKKHILRLAVYELHKLISPTNVSSARITDYQTSINWLRDAGKLRINPQIPRKLEKNGPTPDFAVATFMRSYDPYENMWQI